MWGYYKEVVMEDDTIATSSEILAVTLDGDVIGIDSGDVYVSSDFGTPVGVVANTDGSLAVVEFEGRVFVLFDAAANAWSTLDTEGRSFVFSPDGEKLGYIVPTQTGSEIYILDLNTQDLTLVSSLSVFDISLHWPEEDRMVFVSLPSYHVRGEAWMIDLSESSLERIGSGLGLGYVFDNGKGLKFSNKDQSTTLIQSVTLESGDDVIYQISTLPQKCVVGERIICAIPYQNNSTDVLTLPDDYLQDSVRFHDGIYELNDDGRLTEHWNKENGHALDVGSIVWYQDTLLIISRLDKGLYQLVLDYPDVSGETSE